LVVMGITGLWALLRLHERPRAGWIVLTVTALTAFQLASFWGVSMLVSIMSSFGGLPAEYLYPVVLILTNVAEIAIWWLLLLGLFGSHPFRGSRSPEEDSESP
ncbi:MAG TPA: hypothetical protein VM165_09095, partial [Planctomycetaceae bacterium]|nr:hypothetical protein [Planctomycetaceae bacterium]